MTTLTPSRRRRKASPCSTAPFDRRRDVELLTIPAVRAVMRRARVSPSLAFAIAELSGLLREVKHV